MDADAGDGHGKHAEARRLTRLPRHNQQSVELLEYHNHIDFKQHAIGTVP